MDSAKRLLRAQSGFLCMCCALSLQVIPTLFWRRSGAAFRSRSCKGTATASASAAAILTGTITASSFSGGAGKCPRGVCVLRRKRTLAAEYLGEQFDAVQFQSRSCKGTATATASAAAPITGTITASSFSGGTWKCPRGGCGRAPTVWFWAR